MSNQSKTIHPFSKKCYWVNFARFYNDKTVRNGYQKAVDYCLEHFIDSKDIIQFDSDTECDYYEYLLKRQNANEIKNLSHHFLIKLLPEYTNANGDVIPEITYNADFTYYDNKLQKQVVVDVKSSEYFLNNDGGRFILLKSVFDRVFLNKGLYIQIIIKKGKGEFYEWHIGDKQKSSKLIKKQSSQIKELRKQIHETEMANKKADREKARLIELRGMRNLTTAQKKRLAELEEKYKI